MGSVHSKSYSFGSVGSYLEYERIIYHINSGDLIEIHRNSYKHWAICERIDENGIIWCFHVTGTQLIDNCNDTKEVAFNGKASIKYEPLLDILKDNNCSTPSLCRINNQKIMAQNMLKTTRNQMPDTKEVFKMLHRLKDSFVKYDLKSLNCEHYCTLWKYGIGWSSQVNSYQDIVTAALKMVSSFSGVAGEALTKNGFYRAGSVCLIISSIAAITAKLVENISFTLNELKIENFVKHAIAF
jgi:hypothetical protein